MGTANANVAKMVIDDINTKGGLLGRQIELILVDSETNDEVAAVKAHNLVEKDNVDVVFGGIFSSTRQAIKVPVVGKARKLYIYPEQYEGEESDPLIFCTGPVPANRWIHSFLADERKRSIINSICHPLIISGRTQ
jgi:branched-chain amino acid transport system substrate-binding protein